MSAKLSIIYFLIGVARVTNLLHFREAYKNGASEWVRCKTYLKTVCHNCKLLRYFRNSG